MLWYTKTIICWIKGLIIKKKRCLNWISFHDDLYCCVGYSNVENQYLSLKNMLKSEWLTLILDVDLMTLTILKLEFSFIFLEFTIHLRASSQNFVENHQINVILL